MLRVHHRQHDTGETLPPCVCCESSQSRRLKDFEMFELLCLCNTLTLTSSSAFLSNCCWSNISRPFKLMSHTQTPVVTQVWVTANDLPCESHDSPLPVPWNYNSKNKTVTGICANMCLLEPQNYNASLMNTIMICKVEVSLKLGHFNTRAILFWDVTSLCEQRADLCSASQVTGDHFHESTLTQSKYHQIT